ncbi:hypothetical protein GCM10023335_51280 [Streptomyces siamensis]|uniref:Uncharacterized protein n=1 Tax=Streptomyces siamensis TaxID=1274986 RepID=A0ABP9J593_9ACTN
MMPWWGTSWRRRTERGRAVPAPEPTAGALGTERREACAYQLGGVMTQIEVAGSSPGLTYQCGVLEEYVMESPASSR